MAQPRVLGAPQRNGSRNFGLSALGLCHPHLWDTFLLRGSENKMTQLYGVPTQGSRSLVAVGALTGGHRAGALKGLAVERPFGGFFLGWEERAPGGRGGGKAEDSRSSAAIGQESLSSKSKKDVV